MSSATDAGRNLANAQRPAGDDPERSAMQYAERARTDDWTLRSALVRFAQSEPERAGVVLELVRRCDAATSGLAKALVGTTVTDTDTDTDTDFRAVALARLIDASDGDGDAIVAGYESVTVLDPLERDALGLLGAVLMLDDLAETMASWAAGGSAEPPVDAVDAACAAVAARFEVLGIEPERHSDAGDARRPRRTSKGV